MNAKPKILSVAAIAGVLAGSTALVQAQERTMSAPGTSGTTPGHEMQQKGSVPGQPRRGMRGDRDDKMTGFGGRDRDDRKFDRDDHKRIDRDDK